MEIKGKGTMSTFWLDTTPSPAGLQPDSNNSMTPMMSMLGDRPHAL
jgi:hypothetical protein